MTQERWQRITQWPLFGVSLAFLAAYSIQVIANLHAGASAALSFVIAATWVVFFVEFGIELVLAENRWRWFLRNSWQLVILALPALRPLMLISVLRVVRRTGGSALRGQLLSYMLGASAILVYVGSLAVLAAEENAPGSNIKNFGQAVWWAVVTMTTGGYGDFAPVTVLGRLIAVGLMVAGIAVIGVVTASVASWLVEEVTNKPADATADAADATDETDKTDKTDKTDASALRADIAQLNERIDELSELLNSTLARLDPEDRA